MPDTDLIPGESFGDHDVDPEDPSPSLFDEGSDEWIDTENEKDSGE